MQSSSKQIMAEIPSRITYDESKLTNILLNGKNYLPWSRSITIALGGRSKLHHINDDPPESSLEDVYKKWRADDYLVMSWLFKTMEPEISEIFMYADSAKELWLSLHSMYSQQNNAVRVFELQRELSNIKQDHCKTFTEHFSRIQKIWEELKIYRPFTTDAQELKKREEEDKLFQLLATMTDEYKDLRNQVLRTVPLPSVINVCTMILREETGKKVIGAKQGGENTESNVFVAKSEEKKRNDSGGSGGSSYTRGRGRGRGGGQRPQYFCEHCNKSGHSKERCWELNPHLQRENISDKKTVALADSSENVNQIVSNPNMQFLVDKFKDWLQSNHGSSAQHASLTSTPHASGIGGGAGGGLRGGGGGGGGSGTGNGNGSGFRFRAGAGGGLIGGGSAGGSSGGGGSGSGSGNGRGSGFGSGAGFV